MGTRTAGANGPQSLDRGSRLPGCSLNGSGRGILAALAILVAPVGCGDGPATEEPVAPDAAPDAAKAEDEGERPPGGARGRVLDPDGDPVAGASALVCGDFCVAAVVDEAGFYEVHGLPPLTYKVRIVATKLGFMIMELPQVVSNTVAELPRPVTLVPITEEPIPWPVEAGGSVTVAQGKLELTAPAGDADFPLGAPEELWAAAVPPEHLPPYQEEPWIGREAGTHAFHINPDGIEGTQIGFRVLATQAQAGDVFRAFQVSAKTGELEEVGTATADAGGTIASDDGTKLTVLTTLLLVPAD